MPTTLTSTRFGEIEVPDEAIVEFPNGLIGLGGSRYALLPHDSEGSFFWLQSIDDADLALPLANPFRFFSGYEVELSDAEAERIGVSDPAMAEVFVTVRAADTPQDFSANLRAPIIISSGRGHQVINEAADAPVRAPLFAQPAA
jgi:flagellar assembly factor FliW